MQFGVPNCEVFNNSSAPNHFFLCNTNTRHWNGNIILHRMVPMRSVSGRVVSTKCCFSFSSSSMLQHAKNASARSMFYVLMFYASACETHVEKLTPCSLGWHTDATPRIGVPRSGVRCAFASRFTIVLSDRFSLIIIDIDSEISLHF